MQFIPLILTAVQTIGAVNSANTRARQTEQAAEYNATIARQQADVARQQSAANAAAQSRKARLQIGSMRAGYGASGLGVEGSPLDILEQSAATAELDRQNILYGGALKAHGYDTNAGLELMRGQQGAYSARAEGTAALLKGIGGMATGIAGMYKDSSSSPDMSGGVQGGWGNPDDEMIRVG